MENYDVIGSVNTLLQSDIQTSKISKETGISKGYITNLRNGNRNITKASYEVVEKLFQYYLEKREYIEASKDIDENILKTQIPKDIQQFISSLKESIDNINDSDTNNGINEITFKQIFNMNKSKQSNNFIKPYWQVDETIPLKFKYDIFAYQLTIFTPIEYNININDEIKDFEIIFNHNELELMLKQLIYKGAKVKLIKPSVHGTGVYIDTTQDEIFKYETSFIDIKVNFDNKGGIK
jgi:transcriptional regulator with XRE-family HTH domain